MPVALYIGMTKKLLLLWAVCTLWGYAWPRRPALARVGGLVLVLIAISTLVYGVLQRPMDHDEIEHLHCTWMVAKGQVPFHDFWQHHSPMMYLLLAPLMRLGLDPVEMPRVFRTLTLCILGLTIWVCSIMSRRLWDSPPRLGTWTLLWLTALWPMELFTPRPDVFATLLVLSGVCQLMPTSPRDKARWFVAGFLQGFGLTFAPKLYPILLAPGLVALRERRKGGVVLAISYAAGVFCGVLPLAAYLAHHGLFPEFRDWVIAFNLRHQKPAGMYFHPVLLGLGLLGCRELFNRCRAAADRPALLFLLVYVLTTWAVLQNPLIQVYYYAAPWMALSIVAAGRASAADWLERLGRASLPHAAVGGLGLALLFDPMAAMLNSREDPQRPAETYRTWSRLCRISENQPVVAMAPYHPVFAEDAVGLFSEWQATFTYLDPELRKLLNARHVAASIMDKRPAIISQRMADGRQDLVDYLVDVELVSPRERGILLRFLSENYTLVSMGRPFYVRNDLVAGR